MCYLITIGVSAPPGDLVDLFRTHELHMTPAVNPDVRAAMSNQFTPFDITNGGCSCSLYAGISAGSTLEEGAERARYARKGWSEAKITRALEAKRTSHGRSKSGSKAEQWFQCVQALSKSGSKVAILVHDYHGLFAEEVVSVAAKARMSLQQFIASRGAIPEDTLVSVE